MVDLERIKWEGSDALTPGRHTVEFDFTYNGIGVGTLAYNNFSGVCRPGVGTLRVDGNVVTTKKMDRTLPMILQWDESFDIGSDTLTGVNDDATGRSCRLRTSRGLRRQCRKRRRPIDQIARGTPLAVERLGRP
jgi:hypothetical protein